MIKKITIFQVIFFLLLTSRCSAQVNSLEGIKHRLVNNPRWVSYLAVKSNSFAPLDALSDPDLKKEAWSETSLLFFIKQLALGQVNNLPAKFMQLQDVAMAVNTDNPSGLTGYKINLYNAFKNNSVAELIVAFNDPNFLSFVSDKKGIAEMLLNVYDQFKFGSSRIKYSDDTTLLKRLAAGVISSNKDPNLTVDSIAQDIMVFLKEKAGSESSLCSSISNSTIRRFCSDPSVNDLNSLLKKVWE